MSRLRKVNWGIVLTKGEDEAHLVQERFEAGMEERLKVLKDKWYSTGPGNYPDLHVSIMAPDELVFVGRYPEGIVLRLNDDKDQITFLTNEMAAVLAKKLVQE
jgi:hypothetical protein